MKNVVLTVVGEKAIDTIRERMEPTQTGLDKLSDDERAELFRLLMVVFPG